MKANQVNLLPSSRTGWISPFFLKYRALPRLMIFLILNFGVVLSGNDPRLMAQEPSKVIPNVSFEVKDAPLKVLIEKHLDSTGYKVKGWESWGDVRVTLKVQGAPLDEALRSILKRAGINNYVMKIDEAERQITLRRLRKSEDSASRPVETRDAEQIQGGSQPVFVPPPEVKETKGPTDRETLDREATPPPQPAGETLIPSEPQGGPGKTQKSRNRSTTPTGRPEGNEGKESTSDDSEEKAPE